MADWVEGNGHRDAGLPPAGTGRRRSMVILAGLLVALPTAYLVSTVAGSDWRAVTSLRVLEARGVIYVSNLRVFVVHTDQGPLALSALSPHDRHRVLYCPSAMAYQEAHRAVFDHRGLAIDGPVSRGLDRVAVRVVGQVVQVDPSEVEPGPPRGEGPTEDVSGLLCRVPGPEDPPGFAAARLAPA